MVFQSVSIRTIENYDNDEIAVGLQYRERLGAGWTSSLVVPGHAIFFSAIIFLELPQIFSVEY
jgi:hypothetical protein